MRKRGVNVIGGQKIIAVCAAKVHEDDVQSYLYPLHLALDKNGYKDLVLATTTDLYENNLFDKGEAGIFRLIDSNMIDAVVLFANTLKNDFYIDDIIKYAAKRSCPVIVVDDSREHEGCTNVLFDESDAFYKLVDHLAEKHHFTKINCIAGIKGNSISERREAIYKQVLAEHGIPFEEKRFGYGCFYSYPTKQVMQGFLDDPDGLPEAIVCINDSMAITVCEMLSERGIKVPEQVAVTGFDGIEQEKYNFPRISTCRRDMDRFAQMIADILKKLFDGGQTESCYKFPYTVDYSESCGCKEISEAHVNKSLNLMFDRINDDYRISRSMNNMMAKLANVTDIEQIRRILKSYMNCNTYVCVNKDFHDMNDTEHTYSNSPFTDDMIYSKYFYGTNNVETGRYLRNDLFPDKDMLAGTDSLPFFMPLHDRSNIYGYMILFAVNERREYFSQSIRNVQRFIASLNTSMSTYVQQRTLRMSNVRLNDIQNNIISSFADMVESRDKFTGKHVKRTGEYLKVFSSHLAGLPEYSEVLSDEYRQLMYKAAPLHDIGKIKISDSILNKPGRLTPEEFDVIKTHTIEGAKIIEQTLRNIENNDYIETAEQMALYHHEKWNGTGYPMGLAGEQIPLCARIMAVVDVFDALTSKRVYKDAFSVDKAIDILKESSGSHFEPELVDEFIKIRSKIEKVFEENSD